MSPTCPSCAGSHLVAVADYYDAQVRRPDADPEALAPLAPPIRRSIFHGTACITLFFLAVLSPGFVPEARSLAVGGTFALLGSAAFLLWVRTRRTDRAAMAAYQKRRLCPDCHWVG